jgi:hypothetical protein
MRRFNSFFFPTQTKENHKKFVPKSQAFKNSANAKIPPKIGFHLKNPAKLHSLPYGKKIALGKEGPPNHSQHSFI